MYEEPVMTAITLTGNTVSWESLNFWNNFYIYKAMERTYDKKIMTNAIFVLLTLSVDWSVVFSSRSDMNGDKNATFEKWPTLRDASERPQLRGAYPGHRTASRKRAGKEGWESSRPTKAATVLLMLSWDKRTKPGVGSHTPVTFVLKWGKKME